MSRVFIIDLCAIFPYGHNATLVYYYVNYYKHSFDETIPIVCKELPEEVDFLPMESRYFPFYYSRSMIRSLVPYSKSILNFNPTQSIFLRNIRKKINKLFNIDLFELSAENNFKKLLTDFNVNKNDKFLFPSTSYYGITGILRALEKLPYKEWPHIHFRFINVMENANINNNGYNRITKTLRNIFKENNSARSKLYLSTETHAYSRKVAMDIDQYVSVTPYPPINKELEDNTDNIFTILCPGAPRRDKGFFKIKGIINTFYKKYPNQKIRLMFQTLSQEEMSNSYDNNHYISQLMAIPYVSVIPNNISYEEMINAFSKCDAILLPYDPTVYKLRGSGIFMEALNYKKPVIANNGCGFSDLVNLYGNGYLCDTEEEYADAIMELLHIDNQELNMKLEKAHQYYLLDCEESYSRLWGDNIS